MSYCKKMYETQQYIIDRFAKIGVEAKSMILGDSYCPYCGAKIN